MAPGDLERALKSLPADKRAGQRLLAGTEHNEDAAVVLVPEGKALVQTVDFFTPIVNDPYIFGQIAAANALSDVYAMGGEPWTAMNLVCFPAKSLDLEILGAILRGGAEKVMEAGAVLAGGHSIEDAEIKYGLSVTGLVDPRRFARNSGLRTGDALILTKALGTGILATAIKANWQGADALEAELCRQAARLNAGPGRVIRELGLAAATDITGFGLGGHALEMAEASQKGIVLRASALPLMSGVLELAGFGLVPGGSHSNRKHRECFTLVEPGVDPMLVDVIFDAQTSGGLLLAVSKDQVSRAVDLLLQGGDLAAPVGEVVECVEPSARLRIVP